MATKFTMAVNWEAQSRAGFGDYGNEMEDVYLGSIADGVRICTLKRTKRGDWEIIMPDGQHLQRRTKIYRYNNAVQEALKHWLAEPARYLIDKNT